MVTFPFRSMKGLFSSLHHQNLEGPLEGIIYHVVKDPSKAVSPGVFNLSGYSVLSLQLLINYCLCVLTVSGQSMWFLIPLSCDSLYSPVSPAFRAAPWPQSSDGSKKSCSFSFCLAFFFLFEDGSNDFQVFYISERKLNFYGHVLISNINW